MCAREAQLAPMAVQIGQRGRTDIRHRACNGFAHATPALRLMGECSRIEAVAHRGCGLLDPRVQHVDVAGLLQIQITVVNRQLTHFSGGFCRRARCEQYAGRECAERKELM